jgi:hypothetical protein
MKNIMIIFVSEKEYDDEALGNDEYAKKNDEIYLIENNLMSILVYIH